MIAASELPVEARSPVEPADTTVSIEVKLTEIDDAEKVLLMDGTERHFHQARTCS